MPTELLPFGYLPAFVRITVLVRGIVRTELKLLDSCVR